MILEELLKVALHSVDTGSQLILSVCHALCGSAKPGKLAF